ncbi:MAG TPA: ExeM/NucH family extracellular endonuclease [Solirubrobacteraceae bacterium]|nr:ExeM/NucH family extracellular endonuclease [Solirubrobacteraceae bacterium]
MIRRTALSLALAALAAAPTVAQAASPDLVVSQVYGGGGNSGAAYTHDYVELFNRGTAPVSTAGRSVQYASATGTGAFQATPLPDATVQPGQAFLVQLAAGAGNGQALPAPDATGGLNLSGTGGKVALATGTESLGCNGGSIACSDEQRARITDLVGYGAANFYEGSAAAPATSNATAAIRAGGGCTDTDDNAADFTAGPPAPRTSTSAAAACDGGPQPPTVTATTPTDGERAFPEDGTLSVTFSEPVDDAVFTLTCAGADQPATATQDGATWTVDPAQSLPRGATCTLQIAASGLTDEVTFGVAERCEDAFTTIPGIQGSGATSPLEGKTVSTQGVVVGDFQGLTGDGSLSGFFLQDPRGDGDPRTSDGIFVYAPGGAEVSEGDVVRVRGEVAEFRRNATATETLTQLTGVTVTPCATGAHLPRPATLTLPQSRERLERLESMRVRSTQRLTVTEMFNLRFGEVLLSSIGPLVQPTEILPPGRLAAAADRLNTDSTVLLDDGRSATNLNPIRFTSDATPRRRGDRLTTPLTGILHVDFDAYRVQPTEAVAFDTGRNPRTARPANVGGTIRAGSFNVLNFFVTFGRSEDRGADDAGELAQQEAKIVKAINGQDAAVLGLQEIQDTTDEPTLGNDPDAALDRLVRALNADAGFVKWAKSPVPQPFGNTDEIRVAQIYQPAKVKRVGAPVAFNDPRFIGIARVPIAQTYRAGSDTFTVIANHFKSKGCGGATGADADQGDGQSCFNATRVTQARALLEFVAERQRATGDEDVLVVGDLNAYSAEHPIRTLERGGLTNLHRRFEGLGGYSYVFSGRQGTLDHALATRSLTRKATGATEWHINADEAVVEQYDGFDELYDADPYRSSDHDASLAGFRLR